jgi:hypothetical protein
MSETESYILIVVFILRNVGLPLLSENRLKKVKTLRFQLFFLN